MKDLRKGTKGHIRSSLTSVAIAILNIIIQEIALGFFYFSVLRDQIQGFT